MSDEINDASKLVDSDLSDAGEVEDIIENPSDEELTGLSDSEREAMECGWLPQDQYNVPGKKWHDHETFLDIYRARQDAKKSRYEAKRLHDTLTNFSGYIDQVKKNERDKTLRELNQQRDDAIEEGDKALVKQYDDLIDEVKSAPTSPKIDQENPLQEEANAFIERNRDWFNDNTPKNQNLKQLAMIAEQRILQSNKNIHPADLYRQIEREVKELLGTATTSTKRPAGNTRVASSNVRSTSASRGAKPSRSDLSREQCAVMDAMINENKVFNKKTRKLEPIMTEEQYLNDLFSIGVIKKN